MFHFHLYDLLKFATVNAYNSNFLRKVFTKMDFAAIMKDEIGKKRKKVESDLKIGQKNKKYFKRGELAKVERAQYEEKMGIKLAPASEDRIKALEQKTQNMLDRLGPDQAKMMPREVKKNDRINRDRKILIKPNPM